MLTPKLVVTKAGLNIANQATPTGPWINIKKFKIYSEAGYNYDSDTIEQRGDFLFGDTPLSYRNIGDNTLDIVCMIPAEAGPFQYGSIGLYVEDANNNDVLFAIAVYDTPQVKYSSLGSNVASSSIFHCLLKLTQSTAVFKIDTLMPTPVQEVDYWHEVLPPSRAANEYPLLLVREQDPYGRTSLLHVSDDEYWTVGTTYPIHKDLKVKNATRSWIDVDVTDGSLISKDLTTQAGRYILEVRSQGVYRYVTQVTQQGLGTYRFHLSVELVEIPAVGSALRMHRNDGTRGYYEVPLSSRNDNQIQQADDGIYVGPVAPADVASIYVDAVNGNDSNPGTRAAPMKTIRAAVGKGPSGVNRDLYLYEGQQHVVTPESPAYLRGGRWEIFPYGPVTDNLPPVPGNNKYAQMACVNLNTRIVAGTFQNVVQGGANYQRPIAFSPTRGAEVSMHGLTLVAGSPNSSGYPIIRDRGSFSTYVHSWHYRFSWCRFSVPHAQSAIIGPADFPSTAVFLGGGNPILTGVGKLIATVSEPLSVQLRSLTGSGVIGTSGRTILDYLPSNLSVSNSNIYNFKSDLNPDLIGGGGGGAGDWVNLPASTPAPRRGFVVISQYGGEWTFASFYVNGRLITRTGDYYHDRSHFGRHSITLPLNKGDVWTYVAQNTRGSTRPEINMFYGLD